MMLEKENRWRIKRDERRRTTKKISEKYFQTDVSVKPKETMTQSVSD